MKSTRPVRSKLVLAAIILIGIITSLLVVQIAYSKHADRILKEQLAREEAIRRALQDKKIDRQSPAEIEAKKRAAIQKKAADENEAKKRLEDQYIADKKRREGEESASEKPNEEGSK